MYGDVLLFCLLSVFRDKGSGQCSWERAVVLVQVGQSARIAPRCHVCGGGRKQMALTFSSILEISAAHGGFPQLPVGNLSKGYQAFCVVSLSLVCWSEAVHSALSSLVGAIVLYRHVYLSSFLGGRVLLLRRHLGLLFPFFG